MIWPRTAIAILALAVAVADTTGLRAETAQPEFVAPAARNVTPPGITPGPPSEGPLVREPVPPPPPEPPRWRRFFLPETTDAATFEVKSRTIQITGVSAPSPDEKCPSANGGDWPCGQTALYSLRMFLRGRAVECFFPPVDATTKVIAPCRVGQTDLGLWLLSQGWVRIGEYATDEYRATAHAARCAGLGLWRGDNSASEGCQTSAPH